MLWLPKWLREDEEPPQPLPRRQFFYTVGSAVAGAFVATQLPSGLTAGWLDPGLRTHHFGGFSSAQANILMREVMLPKVREFLTQSTVLLHYLEKETAGDEARKRLREPGELPSLRLRTLPEGLR